MATRTLRKKKQLQGRVVFFDLIFNVYSDVDNRERARESNKKNREDEFSSEEKHEIFLATVRKWEILAATSVGCSRAKQRQRNLQKKCAARANLFFAN